MSRREEPQTGIRDINHLNVENVLTKEENNLRSPGFKSVESVGGDYGVVAWANATKNIEMSQSQNVVLLGRMFSNTANFSPGDPRSGWLETRDP